MDSTIVIIDAMYRPNTPAELVAEMRPGAPHRDCSVAKDSFVVTLLGGHCYD